MTIMEPATPPPANSGRRSPLVFALLAAALIVAAGAWLWLRSGAASVPRGSRQVTLEVGGMVCQACVIKINDQLTRVPGVSKVEVSLERQSARVVCAKGLADTALTAAVRRAGPDYVGLILAQ